MQFAQSSSCPIIICASRIDDLFENRGYAISDDVVNNSIDKLFKNVTKVHLAANATEFLSSKYFATISSASNSRTKPHIENFAAKVSEQVRNVIQANMQQTLYLVKHTCEDLLQVFTQPYEGDDNRLAHILKVFPRMIRLMNKATKQLKPEIESAISTVKQVYRNQVLYEICTKNYPEFEEKKYGELRKAVLLDIQTRFCGLLNEELQKLHDKLHAKHLAITMSVITDPLCLQLVQRWQALGRISQIAVSKLKMSKLGKLTAYSKGILGKFDEQLFMQSLSTIASEVWDQANFSTMSTDVYMQLVSQLDQMTEDLKTRISEYSSKLTTRKAIKMQLGYSKVENELLNTWFGLEQLWSNATGAQVSCSNQVLGKGTFGNVYLGQITFANPNVFTNCNVDSRNLLNNKTVALKYISKQIVPDEYRFVLIRDWFEQQYASILYSHRY